MEHIKTHYCRDKWNDLTRISIDNKNIYFELGYCLKSSVKSRMKSYNNISTYNKPFFKWKYEVDINDNDITLKCINIVDKEKYINQDDVKYNIWHTSRCENLEKNFPKFASDLQKNFPKQEWIQIIIEVFPSISSYPKKHCDFVDYEDILAKDWIKNKRQENWED